MDQGISAVIYLRAGYGGEAGAAERAARAFAEERGMTVADVVLDPRDAPDDPGERAGWRRVRETAARGGIGVVIVPLPTTLAPERAHELRYRETRWLLDRGVRLRYAAAAPPEPTDRTLHHPTAVAPPDPAARALRHPEDAAPPEPTDRPLHHPGDGSP